MILHQLNSSVDNASHPDPEWYAAVYGKEAKQTWMDKLKSWLRRSTR